MIKFIKNSELDNERFSQILTPIDTKLDGFDFRNLVVKKPWGYEYLFYEDDLVSAWILHIKSGSLTSMHCHSDKKTALLVLQGEAVFSTLNEGMCLKESQGVVLEKRVFHSTQAISENELIVIEVETPPRKTDLIRLVDSYGRELKGYEAQSEMSKELETFSYKFISKEEAGVAKQVGNMSLSLEKVNNENIKNILGREGIAIVLDGKIRNAKTRADFSVGDILHLKEGDVNELKVESEAKLIKINHPNQYVK